MQIRKIYLATASLTLTLFAGGPAMAQGAAADDAEEQLEEVIVVGVRAAIQRAQDIKRQADSVVEAVTFEDLGQFSDESVVDTLQRVPGVQIDRNDTGIDGDRVSIRGMGSGFVTTTINGRTPLTNASNTRKFNLEVIPPEVISGLMVYKTPTASLIETGLAGTVDFQTMKPLDLNYRGEDKSILGVLNVRYADNDLTDGSDPRISGILAGKNSSETVGAYFSVLWSESDIAVDELFVRGDFASLKLDNDGDGVQDGTLDGVDNDGDGVGDGVFRPRSFTHNAIRGDINRTAMSGALQLRPNDKLEITIDAFYSEIERLSNRPRIVANFVAMGGIYRGLFTPDSLVVENNAIMFMDPSLMTGLDTRVAVHASNLKFDNESETKMIGLNAKWDNDNWRVSFDYSRSEVDRENGSMNMAHRRAEGLDQSLISYDAIGRKIPLISYGDDVLDPASYGRDLGLTLSEGQLLGEEDAFKLDFTWDLNDRLVLHAGVRYTDTLLDLRNTGNLISGANAIVGAERTAMYDAAWASGELTDRFLADENIGLSQWPAIDFDAGFAAGPDFLPSLTARGTSAFSGNLQDEFELAVLNNGTSYWLKEKTLAYYGQLDFKATLRNVPVSGNVGLRAVQSKDSALGSSQTRLIDPEGILDPVIIGGVGEFAANTRWDYLPAINVNFEFRDHVRLRLGASQVMTRPPYRNLVTRESLTRQNPDAPLYDPNENGTGSAANADLKPYTAWQFDATLEYYTDNGGALYASLFYKDVKDFIMRQSLEGVELPGHDDILWDINQSENWTDGEVRGFEIGLNQPLSFLPVDGFGMQANYTYVDSSFEKSNIGDSGFGFPGSSEDNFNLVAYYEQGKFSIRAAYVYRSDYLLALGGGTDRGATAIFTKANDRLDLRMQYKLNENISLSLSGTNLTGEDRQDYMGHKSIYRGFVERGTEVIFGVRAMF